jgi:phage recombination protein Bet
MTPLPTGTELIQSTGSYAPGQFSQEKLALIKQTVAKGTTDLEFAWFMENCRALGLDPLRKQIYCVKRFEKKTKTETMTIQIGIDGFRLQAQRTNEYIGQTKPEWCDRSGRWVEVWTQTSVRPTAARVGVYRKGFVAPVYAVAHYTEFEQNYYDPEARGYRPAGLWAKMPLNQLIKCAEAAALRKTFPAELSGYYVPEEMPPEPIGFDGDGAPGSQMAPEPPSAAGPPEPSPEQAPPPPPPPPPAEEKPRLTRDQVEIFKYFGPMKKEIGEANYYRILGANGFEHCNEIPDINMARVIYKQMQECSHELSKNQPRKNDGTNEQSDDDDADFYRNN